MVRRLIFFALLTLDAHAATGQTESRAIQNFVPEALPALPYSLKGYYAGALADGIVVAGGERSEGVASDAVFFLASGAAEWKLVGQLSQARSHGAAAVYQDSLILAGGESGNEASNRVTQITLTQSGVNEEALAPLPLPLANPAALVDGSTLWIAGGSVDGTSAGASKSFLSLNLAMPASTWRVNDAWEGPPLHSAFLIKSVDTFSLFGGTTSEGTASKSSYSFHSTYGWRTLIGTAPEGTVDSAAKLGDSHAIAVMKRDDRSARAYLYHTIGNTWVSLGDPLDDIPDDAKAISTGSHFTLLSSEESRAFRLETPDTNYGWWDHISVAVYFLVLIYVGFHFSKQSKSSDEFFRGGHKIPWWATGMSLFATGASAMSLMAMPAKSYSSNWTFFAISVYFVLALPLSMYFLAPLVRKLNYGTAFEYLEHRFGLSVRILGSAIFAIGQILGRMGSVLLLPSFALEAIAGIPIEISVPAMGLVTIAYTYLGGLAAVIWTDTIQGLVMVASILGCLILVFFKIDMPAAEVWLHLETQSKLHVFDWGIAFNEENVPMVFLGVVALTLLYIGDQNYVQRVQCTRTLKDAKKAIATQLGVAVPINLLLFGLGTALFLFYKQQPAELNPAMKNDGIFPFFAAQQLPPGVSGLVIAALLAATMSTISSSICSVSNLAVDDFYKRFSRNPSESKAVLVGRIATLVIGLFGIASAFYLNSFETPSVWDLFLRVAGIIAATTLGTFALGLFSRKANEIGVLAGILAGMGATYLIAKDETIIFWLYPIYGSLVTFIVGYAISLATGGNRKNIDGLTYATLKQREGGLDD